MQRGVLPWAVLALFPGACGPAVSAPADDATTSAAETSSSGGPTPTPPSDTTAADPTPSTSSGTTTALDDTTASTTDGSFLMEPDLPPALQCDFFEQDCPRGEKCKPIATGRDGWDGLVCRPIAEDPVGPGQTCTFVSGPSGSIDTCDGTSLCYGIDLVTFEGTCISFCEGSAEAPQCPDPDDHCLMFLDAFGVCLQPCDPLLADCPAPMGCYPLDGQFLCGEDRSGRSGAPGTSCEQPTDCDPGALCATADTVPGCATASCCTSYCSLDDPMPPCLPGQSCVPWPGQPPGSMLGACG